MTDKELLAIFEECDFTEFGLDEYENDEHIIEKVIDNLIIPDNYKFDYNYGTSKLVISIWNEENKSKIDIIKIPFKGQYIYKYSEDGEEYDDWEEEIFQEYSHSGASKKWDYCEKEVINYNLAKEAEVDFCFAKTELIGYVHNYPIYKQQYVEDTNAYDREDYSEEERKKTVKTCQNKNFYRISSNWLSNVMTVYGEQYLIKLMDFIKENNICDLHDNNLGYHNGAPIIFDYSDFDD